MISPVSKAKVSHELIFVSFGEIANNETKWRLSSNVHREQKERNVGVRKYDDIYPSNECLQTVDTNKRRYRPLLVHNASVYMYLMWVMLWSTVWQLQRTIVDSY